MRGELRNSTRLVLTLAGSSPLARGTQHPGLCRYRRDRFIPACAGNSARPAALEALQPVHPRLRGELKLLIIHGYMLLGSSPLARGTLFLYIKFFINRRFIPACAGNSDLQGPRNIVSPVHPRLRGELVAGHFSSNKKAGSSPLARGTHPRRFQGHLLRRFIPACAGNSIFLITLSISFRVHPRLRGELGGRHTHRTFGSGSSPLARGTHLNKA